MNLKQLIDKLEAAPQDAVVVNGFGLGRCSRAGRPQVDFKAATHVRIGDMTLIAKSVHKRHLPGPDNVPYFIDDGTEITVAGSKITDEILDRNLSVLTENPEDAQ